MKKTAAIVLFMAFLLVSLCSCNESDESETEYIKLCDYKNLTVDIDEYKVSSEDVTTAVHINMFEKNVSEATNGEIEDGDFVQICISKNGGAEEEYSFFTGDGEHTADIDEHLEGHKSGDFFQFVINGDDYRVKILSVRRTPSELTDKIAAEYFGASSAEEAIKNIKQEIAKNRFFEAAQEIILTSSVIVEFPDYCYEYADKLTEKHKKLAQDSGKTAEDYFYEFFQMSEKEYREAALWGYGDYLILKEIAAQEGYVISDADIENLIKYTAQLDGDTYENTKENYDKEYFEYILYETCLKEIIFNLYANQIQNVV